MKIGPSEITSLEHSTLKVPYEILNKRFRAAQKTIDREVSHIHSATATLDQYLNSSDQILPSDVSAALNIVADKLIILKRKASESLQDEVECAQTCKRRVEHIKQSQTLDGPAASVWSKTRLDRMLVEYFLRTGYYKTALKLAEQSNIKDVTNLSLFLTAKEVEDSLLKHETAPCLAWCHDNKSKLRKMKSCLEFNIRQQEFVELIRENKPLEAIKHARKYMSQIESGNEDNLQTMMGLLVYSTKTEIPKYKKLLDPDRWNDLVTQFRQVNFQLHQLHSMSVFSATLQVGLSALKTHQCYKAGSVIQPSMSRSQSCPLCSPHFIELAQPLPYSHSGNSKLVCYISGEPLNEDNPPVMMPNGYVYSTLSVAALANKDNKFTCPRTNQQFDVSDAQKVFIM